jgi:glutamine amidotransferase
MCRLFGYRSAKTCSLEKPLLTEERSLSVLSNEHRDGWGLAYFLNNVPNVIKSKNRAGDDEDFRRLAENLSASTVVAHLRRATQGEISLLNCHPFQFGKWVFAHNGDLPDFNSKRSQFRAGIAPHILSHIFGNTDSEIYFALFLNELFEAHALDQDDLPIALCVQALRNAIDRIVNVYAGYDIKKPFALNAVLSNGSNFLAYRHGHGLYYRMTSEPHAELSVCSEPSSKYAGFIEMHDQQILAMDKNFRLFSPGSTGGI